MCGRYGYFGDNRETLSQLGAVCDAPLLDDYNITPGKVIPVLRRWPETGVLELVLLRWGLLPFWSKTESTKFSLINARAETIDEKPSFRGPFRHRRCVIPANGYYEWQKGAGEKQPWFIRAAGEELLLFAGIWDHWQGENGKELETCAIITTSAKGQLAEIHHRMPVCLQKGSVREWLSPDTQKQELLAMLNSSDDDIEMVPVSSYVNNAHHNGPECTEMAPLRL